MPILRTSGRICSVTMARARDAAQMISRRSPRPDCRGGSGSSIGGVIFRLWTAIARR
jgi:hypothetical protein